MNTQLTRTFAVAALACLSGHAASITGFPGPLSGTGSFSGIVSGPNVVITENVNSFDPATGFWGLLFVASPPYSATTYDVTNSEHQQHQLHLDLVSSGLRLRCRDRFRERYRGLLLGGPFQPTQCHTRNHHHIGRDSAAQQHLVRRDGNERFPRAIVDTDVQVGFLCQLHRCHAHVPICQRRLQHAGARQLHFVWYRSHHPVLAPPI